MLFVLWLYMIKATIIYYSSTIIYLLSTLLSKACVQQLHDDAIKWKHFPRYWQFVRGIHRSPVNSPHKDQWRGALMFSLICALNKREAGDLRRYRTHYDVTVMAFGNFYNAGIEYTL